MPGDATADQMDAIADLMDQFSLGEVRVTHEQNLVLPHVRKQDLPAIYARLKELDFAAPNAGLITDIIACPGLDYCDLANARSIPIAQNIAKKFDDLDRQHQIGELKIKISGCINACGHHHAGHIGILGVDKKGVEFYQLQLGGSGAEDASIGDIMGPGFGEHEIADAVERVVDVYLAERKDGERFLDTYRRIGMEKFKAAAYQEASRGVTKLIKSGAFAQDAFAPVADDAPLPEGAVIVSLARFQKDREALLARNTPVGRAAAVQRESGIAGRGCEPLLPDRAGISQIPRRPRLFLGPHAAHPAGL